MAGLFESFKRLVVGEPVFNAHDNEQGWMDKDGNARTQAQPAPAEPQSSAGKPAERKTGVVKGQSSTFPVVVVKRTRTQSNGSGQTVYCSIVNRSNETVEVDEIEMEGSSRRLGGYLRPGEEREWLCYSGPRSASASHKAASLNYKIEETGDYFQSVYDVEYEYESDKTYSVEELHFRAPIRDIYG